MTNIHNGKRRRGVGLLALAAGAVLCMSGAAGAGPYVSVAQAAPAVDLVDKEASSKTRALASYLQGTKGKGILFGHQHALDTGVTFSQPDGKKSDIRTGTGDYPAVFGWDTLTLEGKVAPGDKSMSGAENAAALAKQIRRADRLGGIQTLSSHMKNFVDGGDAGNTSGDVVSSIMPQGEKNAEFKQYLDLVADTARQSRDDSGKFIPIIFRPFHENNKDWFWWGTETDDTNKWEYKKLYRYTVEYLRDTKNVPNFLYAFSPNGNFDGDSDQYLDTYPGDEWVDVLGYDRYEYNNDDKNSDAWIQGTVTDLAMVSDLADARGKIPAFTEFGRNGPRTLEVSGNKSLNFYTDLLAAIKKDPKAKNMTYMLTWANWGRDQFYVPYPSSQKGGKHEMWDNFKSFYDDPYTIFASDVPSDALTRKP